MPIIQFDVLVPDSDAGEVGETFQRALDILVKHGRLTAGECVHDKPPLIDAATVDELQKTYRVDRGEDPEAAGARVHRFLISAEGASSMNSLAMGLSRVLTPKASLPQDPVELHDQDRFEVASIYPWTVEIRR
ncbi:hypothetical protein [Corynebacterium mayonis]|uniref:hypothetical protein n=1 Tax=Corynebacterium mayonis TaxID=3062461 RepID=UPI003140680C